MSAVTFGKEQLDHMREVLADIVDGRYWHTTEALNLEGLRTSPRWSSTSPSESS